MSACARVALLSLVSWCTIAIGGEASAQYFGRNKVEYADFDFKVFETEHFSVYHYAAEETAARVAARLAERWHARLSRVLKHRLDGRQPLILYASQPEFAQTNVVAGFLNEGIGGVTESARRRIVMPFAPTLGETDRILGHEIVHAFQFDMSGRSPGGLSWPLWAVEGMAQYLALGASDAETAMWLRDAVRSDLVPVRQQDAARRFSPYRYGHAFWAYLAGRFGDGVIAGVLKARGTLPHRILKTTGVGLDELFEDWRTASYVRFRSDPPTRRNEPAPLLRDRQAGKLFLGPALSPDGRHAIFFSEKDRLSLDLFLADTTTGTVVRKLATTAAAARFESLQAVRSAGSWNAAGDRFVFAAVEQGQPALVVFDMTRAREERQIRLPQFGQVLTPSWSPDGQSIAFAALDGGVTDLYVYHLDSGRLRRLTNDIYADLQPEWSPDGRRIAFVTERFSSDAATLDLGRCELAVIDLDSETVRAVAPAAPAKQVNPQWSADGRSLFFLADPDGISNVYRLEIETAAVHQVTDVPGGVSGLAPTSPALSVARDAPVLAVTVFRNGRYEIDVRRGIEALSGTPVAGRTVVDASRLPPLLRADHAVEDALLENADHLPDGDAFPVHAYEPSLFLEAVGPPHISTGGGPFGNYVRAGGSLLFSDLLGERKLAIAGQAGNRLRDLAVGVKFLNRERRWNWGAVAEVLPSLRRLPRTRVGEHDGEPAVTQEVHYFERTELRGAGHLQYALDQARRLEFEAGVRYAAYRRHVSSSVRSLASGRVLTRTNTDGFAGEPATVGEASVAFVRDTAVFGPTSPILGRRSRFEVSTTVGELSATRVLLDHRGYYMPVKPYTIAMRLVHLGQYGPDANDLRLLPTFLGSRSFVRGYGWGSLKCEQVEGDCAAFEELLGSRLVIGNAEIRAPLAGVRSRSLHYGPVPAEAFLFVDSGLVWSRSPAFTAARAERHLVTSFGAGVRLNAFGFPLEVGVVRAMDPPARGWSFDFSFRPGF